MGNTCISMAGSCQCMTKTTKKKKKSETEKKQTNRGREDREEKKQPILSGLKFVYKQKKKFGGCWDGIMYLHVIKILT